MKSITKVWIVSALVLITAAMLVAPVIARVEYNGIQNGDTIFWYEKDLYLDEGGNWDVCGEGDIPTALVHYTDEIGQATNDRFTFGDINDFNLPALKYEDTYYVVNAAGDCQFGNVNVAKPSVTLDVVNGETLVDKLNDKTVTKGTPVAFRIRSNVPPGFNDENVYLELRFTSPNTGQTRIFGDVNYQNTELIDQDFYTTDVDSFGEASDTADVLSGVWQVRAQWSGLVLREGEYVCNNPFVPDVDEFAEDGEGWGFCDFYGEGVDSNTVSFTMSAGEVILKSNKDEVIRENPFAVTITGRGNWQYWLYIEDAAVDCEEYPFIPAGQPGVAAWANDQNCVEDCDPGEGFPDEYADDDTFFTDAQCADAFDAGSTGFFKAVVTTTAGGTRTVEFDTNELTDDRTFTIRVVENEDADTDDIAKVTVSKGSVTVDAAGDKVYYMGEEVALSGENTDSDDVWLYMTGPNLCNCGAPLEDPGEFLASDDDDDCDGLGVFNVNVVVQEDNSWEYDWDTGGLGIDAGTYTIYAVSTANDKCDLANAIYDTVSVTLRKPFLSAELPSPIVAKGDDLVITGMAEGTPDAVFVWVFGTNVVIPFDDADVEDDNTFEYKIEGDLNDDWSSGQYFVVVQHPMYNGEPDIIGEADGEVWNRITNEDLFWVKGPDRLMGSDGATALVEALNAPNVDDIPVKLYFELKDPYINIDPISDKYIGDKFTISGTTNLAVDDTFTVTVTSASFKPTAKEQSGEFSGSAETTKVVKGTGVENTWSVSIDTSPFKPDQYLVSVECIETGTTATADFFVSEVPPTTVPTTAPPTTVPMTTAVTTAPPTTTVPPTTTPGFGAVIALIGLGAVAVLVLRRH